MAFDNKPLDEFEVFEILSHNGAAELAEDARNRAYGPYTSAARFIKNGYDGASLTDFFRKHGNTFTYPQIDQALGLYSNAAYDRIDPNMLQDIQGLKRNFLNVTPEDVAWNNDNELDALMSTLQGNQTAGMANVLKKFNK